MSNKDYTRITPILHYRRKITFMVNQVLLCKMIPQKMKKLPTKILAGAPLIAYVIFGNCLISSCILPPHNGQAESSDKNCILIQPLQPSVSQANTVVSSITISSSSWFFFEKYMNDLLGDSCYCGVHIDSICIFRHFMFMCFIHCPALPIRLLTNARILRCLPGSSAHEVNRTFIT